MYKIAILASLLSLTVGCAKTETKVVDRPDGTPLEVAEFGWNVTYTGSYSDSNGEEGVYEETPTICLNEVSEGGSAMSYCGFNTAVFQDAFSFDGKPYLSMQWFGTYFIEIDGAGDNESTTIDVHGEDANNSGYTYEKHLEITHVSEFEYEPTFAPREVKDLRYLALPTWLE